MFLAASEVGAFLERYEKVRFQPFPAREFTLFQSLLTPQGAVHIPLGSFSLAWQRCSAPGDIKKG